MRPGQLHEPLDLAVPAEFAAGAQAAGITTSLALTVTAERQLLLMDLAETPETVAFLDARASVTLNGLRLSPANADFARLLLRALHSALPPIAAAENVVVPSRLADRLRSAGSLELRPGLISASLAWELASVRAGRTMTEWALAETLRLGSYPLAAERQPVAAASAAR